MNESETDKKELAVAAVLADLPEHISKSALMRKKRIKRDDFPNYVESMLRLFTPAVLPQFFQSLRSLVAKGDKDAMRLVAEMYNFTQKSGINIFNTMIQNNAQQTNVYEKTFDAIVRRIESKERGEEVIDV